MRTVARNIFWVLAFAGCMSGIIVIPFIATIAIAESNARLDRLILILPTLLFLFFVCYGVLRLLRHGRRPRDGHGPATQHSDSEEAPEAEARMMQELYQRSVRMEERLESLETILLGHTAPHDRISK